MRVLIIADNAVTANGINLEMRHAAGCRVTGFLSGRQPCGAHVADQRRRTWSCSTICATGDLTLARIREVRAAAPLTKILLLTLSMDTDWLAQAVGRRHRRRGREAGAAGLASARSCARSCAGTSSTRSRDARCAVLPQHHDLTARELEILQLVASGNSNRGIAQRLWVTEQTVKFHLSNVYRKLGVANRTRGEPRRPSARLSLPHPYLPVSQPDQESFGAAA